MQQTNKIFDGAIFTVAMRWSDRLIGLISTLILARLLLPTDFGIVAMAMLVIGLVDVFLNLGVNQVLIHNKNALQEDYDTAWTIRLIQSVIIGSIVYAAAPIAVEYFKSNEVELVLKIFALSIVIGGLQNIGIIDFQKEMNFGKDFQFFFTKRVVSFVVTIAIAFLYKTYWAMVIGSLLGSITGVIISYRMHAFRPHFSLARIRSIWSFSQWVLFKNIGFYLDASIDRFIIGNKLDASILGGYTLAREVAAIPTTEILAPLGRVLFPAFVNARDDRAILTNRITLAVGVQGLVAIPACVGLIVVAEDLVAVVLGEKWLFVYPIMQLMALSNLIGALFHSFHYALLAIGRVKILALIMWVQFVSFAILIALIGSELLAEDFALMRVLVVGIGTAIMIFYTFRRIETLRMLEIARVLVRPVVSVFLMYICLNKIHDSLSTFAPIVRLLIECSVGMLIYFISVYLVWLIQGRPSQAEVYLVSHAFEKIVKAPHVKPD